jgi:uncharacterized protein (TIGR03083 family)
VIGMVASNRAVEAFRGEAEALSRAVAGLGEDRWARPTRCEPWSVREVLGHVGVVVGWLPQMLAGPVPDGPRITAAQYYRPDARFSAGSNAARIELARARAAGHADGAGLAADFAGTWQQAYRLCRDEPRDRIVCTRHGDAMLLSEFLRTRVVEVAVHGLDMADALDSGPWLTAPAEEVVLDLVMGPEHRAHLPELAWDGPTAVRKVTGRAALTTAESSRIERLGVTWITLG